LATYQFKRKDAAHEVACIGFVSEEVSGFSRMGILYYFILHTSNFVYNDDAN
jgi:hypothetical protein